MAGITTSLVFPDAGVCFDVGQGLPFQNSVPTILLSHGHMDHAAGLPYLIAQKAMTGQPPPEVYMPKALVQPMREIMRIWEKVDGHTYQYQFHEAKPDTEYPLRHPYFFKAFPTFHRIASLGYTVFERKKHLKPEFQNLSPFELGQLRRKGNVLENFFDEPVISFSGDTKIEFLDQPSVRNSRILIMEVTYWDQKKTVENARTWGHIHLDELLPRLPQLNCEKIVLIHASARYTSSYLKEVIDARVPEHFKDRISLFPRPI